MIHNKYINTYTKWNLILFWIVIISYLFSMRIFCKLVMNLFCSRMRLSFCPLRLCGSPTLIMLGKPGWRRIVVWLGNSFTTIDQCIYVLFTLYWNLNISYLFPAYSPHGSWSWWSGNPPSWPGSLAGWYFV